MAADAETETEVEQVREKIFATAFLSLVFAACASAARAQVVGSAQQQQASQTTADSRPSEPRVPLAQAAIAYDIDGHEVLNGRLRTQSLAGTPDAPVRDTRLVVENRSTLFYNYVAGWATFYGEDGVRCGEGLWKLEALAPDEQVEVDTPGLRLTCTPSTWRVVATTLLTRTGDVAKPPAPQTSSTGEKTETNATNATNATNGSNAVAPSNTAGASNANGSTNAASVPPLEINVNGKSIPVQLGNPLEIQVGKERVRIVVQQAP